MGQSLCKLTIVCPQSVASPIQDAVEKLDVVSGYTVIPAEGHGHDWALASAHEQVTGTMKAVMMILILTKGAETKICETIRLACARRDIVYWVEPVEDFGRLECV